jgi:(R,R)-butanediol dehydrogenase/meso-butanediol dehydrogenase/diacetyl reductase
VQDDDVKVKIEYASICASDVHMVNGEWDWQFEGPRILGHEAAGVIVELGPKANIKGLKIGDEVTFYFNEYCGKCFWCRNGQEHLCSHRRSSAAAMAEYCVTGEQTVYKLPKNVDMLKGCMSEPVATCLHGVDLMQIKSGTNAGIFGAGGLGLLMIQLVRLAGATNIVSIEPAPDKRDKALAIGADHVIDPFEPEFIQKVLEVTDGIGFQSIIEASGNPAGAEAAMKTIGRGGHLVFFSLYPEGYKMPLDMWKIFKDEVTICGAYQSPYVFPRVMSILPKIDVTPLTQAIFHLEDFENAWKAQLSRQYPKIVLKCN